MIRSKIKTLIHSIIPHIKKEYSISLTALPEYKIDQPKDQQHGDFSIDLAFLLSKQCKTSPRLLAEYIVSVIREQLSKKKSLQNSIESVTVAGPGFINFSISKTAWSDVLTAIKKEDLSYGKSESEYPSKILLEYVSANPTGPLTIAHGRQACLGDTLANVFTWTGNTVYKEYYLNDGGRQIRLLGESTRARYFQEFGIDCELPADGYQGEYISDIARQIIQTKGDAFLKQKVDENINFFSDFAVNYLMDEIKKDLEAIGVSFDNFFSEQTLIPEKTDESIKTLKKKNDLFEKDAALWFSSTKYGDDKDRVLKKSDGTYTYLVPDIAYHREKFKRGFNRVIDFLGPDHHGYIKRLKASVSALGFDPGLLDILIVQLTTLYKDGEPFRMSTRAGNFISLRQLIDEVGADATRFFFLMRKINSHLDFDINLAKEKSQENPVFYLQYAHARIVNVVKYSGQAEVKEAELSRITEPEEIEIIKTLHDFPYQLIQTARSLEPYRLADYLKDVAGAFHRFYNKHRVVTNDSELTNARLFLCECVRIVLRNGLTILGISQPERM